MNAKQAYNTSFENENIVNYVEKEISKEVEKSAKAGNYYAKVYVHFPDYIDCTKYQAFREAKNPSFYANSNSGESCYLAVQEAAKDIDLDWDFETIGFIADQGEEDDFRFLYACCVLQWVSNKIVKMEESK